MKTYKYWKSKMVTKEKGIFDSADIFFVYLLRPLSIFVSIPFAKTSIKATTITKISLFFAVASFPLFAYNYFWAGWISIMLWNILDFVDGNIARFRGQTSPNGGLWDATVGWIAMFSVFSGMGFISYYHSVEIIEKFVPREFFLYIGALEGFFMIFPRLVMHKRNELYGENENKTLQNRSQFGIVKKIGVSIISINGTASFLFAISYCLNMVPYCLIMYLFLLLVMCVASLYELLKE